MKIFCCVVLMAVAVQVYGYPADEQAIVEPKLDANADLNVQPGIVALDEDNKESLQPAEWRWGGGGYRGGWGGGYGGYRGGWGWGGGYGGYRGGWGGRGFGGYGGWGGRGYGGWGRGWRGGYW